MEGCTNADFIRLAAEANTTPKAFVPKGAETIEQLKKRAVKFFHWLCNTLVKSQGHSVANSASRTGEVVSSPEEQNSRTLSSDKDAKCMDDNVTDAVALTSESKELSSGSSPDNNPFANVLVVSHGGTIRQMLCHFSKNLPSDFSAESRRKISSVSPNTGVSKLIVYVNETTKAPSFIKCISVYDGSHLKTSTERSKDS